MTEHKRRILVVDDERSIRLLIKRTLEGTGVLEVDTASSGLEALELIQDNSYDLMITDLAMPEMDGETLFTAVRERHPNIQVIVFTAAPSVESVQSAVRSQVFDYVRKPVRMGVMIKKVMEALDYKEPSGEAPPAEGAEATETQTAAPAPAPPPRPGRPCPRRRAEAESSPHSRRPRPSSRT